MSELRWNWVYYPYLDAPNKQEESALKAGYIKVVSKDEADKVIAEKDKEIAQLKKACNSKDEWCLHTLKENRHHKYKRCLDNACIEWLKQMNLCNYPGSIVFRNAVRRERKWRELAKKCKEAK